MCKQGGSDYRFSAELTGDGLVAAFGGEISTHWYSEFRNDYNEVCRRLAEVDDRQQVIDLSEATYFGSLFIWVECQNNSDLQPAGWTSRVVWPVRPAKGS